MWACKALSLNKSWHGDSLKLMLKGLKKQNLRRFGGPARTARLWTQAEVFLLVELAGS